jgi:hypothetical protein
MQPSRSLCGLVHQEHRVHQEHVVLVVHRVLVVLQGRLGIG